jgi:hypothetical protein
MTHTGAKAPLLSETCAVVGTALASQVQHVVTNDHDLLKRLAPLGSRLSVVTLSASREAKS